ncbi:MAG: phosphoglycerate kinase [Bacilli bacterium]|nr:phosphoglycerate kinase [Bacilli bacterium]
MKKITDVNINNKIVILRCDYNVPIKDDKILDDTRIRKSVKTINYILERASKLVILSHLGRITTEEDKKEKSLRPVCDFLSKILDKKIAFCTYDEDVHTVIKNNRIVMLENTRFFDLDNKKESNCDDSLSKYFSSFGDIFINDAFGVSHREAASNVGITKYLESANGFLIEEEVNNLNRLLEKPERPYVVVMGGKKVSDKIQVINNLIKKVDKLLIGGAMAFTFLKAKGLNMGSCFVEEEYVDYAKKIIEDYGEKVILLKDCYTQNKELVDINKLKSDSQGLDIGDKTIELFKKELKDSKTIFFNGPMGLFEEGYEYGTEELSKFLNTLDSYIVIGGGDTVNAVRKYVPNNNFIFSTGGGASLEYLEGKRLPGIIEG